MFKCPNCQLLLSEEALSTLPCSQEACLGPQYGVHRLMEPNFVQELHKVEHHFQQFREQQGIRITETEVYEQLPFIEASSPHYLPEWKEFQRDLALIRTHAPSTMPARALNFGSWNGWLSNYLVKMGFDVRAIAYFIDPYDGLGAAQFYHNEWLSLQMDIEDGLDILQENYQLIVLNRGTAFLRDPLETVARLISKLSPDGVLILTGLHFYRNPSKAKLRYQNYKASFQQQYGFELSIKPSKAYLDHDDRQGLKKMGLQLSAYPGKLINKVIASLWPTRPSYEFGIYRSAAQ